MNAQEPQPPALTAEAEQPPEELADQPIAIAEWKRLAPMLRACRQITEADRTPLIAACLEWARYMDATRKVQKHGLVVTLPNGRPIVNPYIAIATKALASCNKLWPELGLTPSSRSRVKAAPAPDEDTFAKFDQPRPRLVKPA